MGVKLEDDSPMPFGVHKDKKMEDVPAKYLLYLLDEGIKEVNVKNYIVDNKQALEKEVKEGR